MKIIDCFIFYNEIDILKYRLNILYDFVDYFVIVESTHSFTGKEKKLYFNENKDTEEFIKFKDKIIHIILDDFPYKCPNINFNNNEQWLNEYYQRDSIKLGLDKIILDNDDVIILSDVDEICDTKLLDKIKKSEIIINNIFKLNQVLYFYNLECISSLPWNAARIMNYSSLNSSLSNIRRNDCYEQLDEGGWRFSYFGDKNFIYNKLMNFSHQEHGGNLDIEQIEKDILRRKGFATNYSTIFTPLDKNSYPPPYNKDFFLKYS